MKYEPHEVSHFSVFNKDPHSSSVYLALNTLAMGDSMAVEFAQQAHYNVLSTLGSSMRFEEVVAYRKVFPRSRTLELLSIDDHMTAQVCTREEHRTSRPLRDTEIFSRADEAYPQVGLVQHPKKRRHNETSGIFLSADVDGIEGIISAPRHRVAVLMRLTAMMARRGCCSADLLSSLLGLWIHVLMFRRPGIDSRHEPRSRVFSLHRDSVNELWALCLLGPLLQADLRASYAPFLFAMDASPSGAGLVAADLPAPVIQELWRYSEQRGCYTRLQNPAAAVLNELGEDYEPEFAPGPPCNLGAKFPLRPALVEGVLYDVVELFVVSQTCPTRRAASWT